jgi:preprotein translocase subunit SecA
VGRAGLERALRRSSFGGDWPMQQWLDEDDDLHEETLRQRIAEQIAALRGEGKAGRRGHAPDREGGDAADLDTQWKDHLAQMDYLRQGIHLRGYAQKNPKQEYKREAFEMFSGLLQLLRRYQMAAVFTRNAFCAAPVQSRGNIFCRPAATATLVTDQHRQCQRGDW